MIATNVVILGDCHLSHHSSCCESPEQVRRGSCLVYVPGRVAQLLRPVFTCSHESLWRCQPLQSPQSTRPVNCHTDSVHTESKHMK